LLYVTVFDWPKDGKLVIPGLKNKVVSAKLLAGGNISQINNENRRTRLISAINKEGCPTMTDSLPYV